MKIENDKKIYLISLVLFSVFLISSNVKAYCTPDDWYVCEGSYAVHYSIGTDCNTHSNSIYCQNGCSNGYCQSAPTQPTTNYQQPTYTQPSYQYVPSYYQPSYYQPSYYQPNYYYSQVCSPGSNYGCISSSSYKICSSDGNGYTEVVCGGGSTCSSGQCIYQCSAGWKCEDSNTKAYQNNDCSWSSSEYCPNGCSGNSCSSFMVCTPGDYRDRFCTSSYQYQYQLCNGAGSGWSTVVINCPAGMTCSNGNCISSYSTGYYTGYTIYGQYAQRPTCTPKYTDSYRCSGNNRQQQYQYADCSTDWLTIEQCSYKCSGTACIDQPVTSTTTVTTTAMQQPTGYFVLPALDLWAVIIILLIILIIFLLLFLFGGRRRRGCCAERFNKSK